MKVKYALILLFFIYIGVRLYFLFTFPPFTDESLYIRWGQLAIQDPDFKWAALQYIHRQPLAIWLFGIGAMIESHPLFGARLMMLFLNIPVFFALWSFTRRQFSQSIALYTVAILALTPLFIFTQTIAIMDGFMFAISCYVLYIFTTPWAKKIPIQSVGIALLLGIACWIKTTALMIGMLALVGLVWRVHQEKLSIRYLWINLAIWIVIPSIVLIPLLMQPNVAVIFHEPDSFILTLKQLTRFPIGIWATNMMTTLLSLAVYLTPLELVALLFAFPVQKRHTLLWLWWSIPILITVAIEKNALVRYSVLGTIALIPLIAYGMQRIAEHIKWKSIPFMLFGLLSCTAVFFIGRPAHYFHLFPAISGEQSYAIGWPSGYGIPELVQWIDTKVPAGKTIYLAVADSPGNPTDYLLAYYYMHTNVRFVFATLTNTAEFQKLQPLAAAGHIYLATRESLILSELRQYLLPIIIFEKPYGQDSIGLYQIVFPIDTTE